jgi:hypothetical protein
MGLLRYVGRSSVIWNVKRFGLKCENITANPHFVSMPPNSSYTEFAGEPCLLG